jgi:parvulin-like peptidyl-prolyl isomerase
MKKILNKIRKATKRSSIAAEQPSSMRITNETVAEHRERILAGGRKFKYPLQTPKHRIVFVTLLLVVFTVAAFFGFFTWSLYIAQSTSQFTQRLTQVLPYPVAAIDGRQVRYSDYLLELRSSLHYLSTKESVNFNSEDGKRQLEYQKRLALNKAEENTYVDKVVSDKKISVSNQEIDNFVNQQINSNQLGVSEQVFRQVISDYYDWSFDEYKASVKHQLLRKKAIAKLDVDGRTRAQGVIAMLNSGKDFADEAKAASDDPMAKTSGGDVGFVSRNTDDPNGIIAAAKALQPGQVSQIIEGVDGFYIVKLYETKDNTIHFAKIYVVYTTFDKQIAQLRQSNKIQEYIKVAETVKPSSQ